MDKTMIEILQQLTNIVKEQQNTAVNAAQSSSTLPDIQPFSNEDDGTDFEEWLERFQYSVEYVAATMKDGVKVKLLMTKLSPSAFGEYKRSCLPDEITKFDFGETKKRLIKLFARPSSLAIDRYECLKARKEDGEEFGVFINRLKAIFRKFRYSELTEDHFKCLILLSSLKSASDAKLRQHILARMTAEETKTTKTPKLFEVVTEELNSVLKIEAEAKALGQSKYTINVVRSSTNRTPAGKKENKVKPNKGSNANKGMHPPNNCLRCGELHWAQNCPKFNQTCKKCSRKGHIEKQCDQIQAYHQNKMARGPKRNKVGLPAACINSTSSSKLLRASIKINGTPINFLLDTGADVNVIDEKAFKAIGHPPIEACGEEAVQFDGSRCKFLGKGIATFQFKGIHSKQVYYVAKSGAQNLFGATAMDEFGFLEGMKTFISGNHIDHGASPKRTTKIRDTSKGLQQKFEPRIGLALLRPPVRPTREELKVVTHPNRKHGAKGRPGKTIRRAAPDPDIDDFDKARYNRRPVVFRRRPE